MNVANRELCQELYKISGWEGPHFVWLLGPVKTYLYNPDPNMPHHEDYPDPLVAPAYDLGYLMRRLPAPEALDADEIYELFDCGKPEYLFIGYAGRSRNPWFCQYQIEEVPIEGMGEEADTPEDAACKLAIELFKQGVLKREQA